MLWGLDPLSHSGTQADEISAAFNTTFQLTLSLDNWLAAGQKEPRTATLVDLEVTYLLLLTPLASNSPTASPDIKEIGVDNHFPAELSPVGGES